MAALTDYKEWLGAIVPNTEEIYQIYTAIQRLQDFGGVKLVNANGGNWMVSYPNLLNHDLILTPASRNAILLEIQNRYFKESDIESWYGMKSAEDKINKKD